MEIILKDIYFYNQNLYILIWSVSKFFSLIETLIPLNLFNFLTMTELFFISYVLKNFKFIYL